MSWSSAAAPAAWPRRWPPRGAGGSVHLIEETDWIGGQLTAQGVSALDEHEHIESVRRHGQLLRAAQRAARSLSAAAPARRAGIRISTPATAGSRASPSSPRWPWRAMMALLQPHIDARAPHAASADQGRCRRGRRRSHRCRDGRRPRGWRARSRFRPAMVIDATELGDLLPLAGAEYSVGRRDHRRNGRAACPAVRAQAALRAELHLCVRPRAAAAGRAPRHRAARALRVLSRVAALQPDASRCTAARSTARRAAG